MASESSVADVVQKKKKISFWNNMSQMQNNYCFFFVYNMTNLSRKKAHRALDEHK